MTQAEKLEALVRKAAQNGWQKGWDWLDTIVSDDAPEFTCKLFLFNHDFARALFGELLVCPMTGYHTCDGKCKPKFENELQQAVISKDPIGYMYGEVFDGKSS